MLLLTQTLLGRYPEDESYKLLETTLSSILQETLHDFHNTSRNEIVIIHDSYPITFYPVTSFQAQISPGNSGDER